MTARRTKKPVEPKPNVVEDEVVSAEDSPFILGRRSSRCLDVTHPKLARVMREALRTAPVDFGVVSSHRSKLDQDEAFRRGETSVAYPNSPHNQLPSLAVNITASAEGAVLAKHIMDTADRLGIEILASRNCLHFELAR